MAKGVMTDAQRRAMSACLATIEECKADIEFLDALGYDTGGDKERILDMREMVERAMEVDEQSKDG